MFVSPALVLLAAVAAPPNPDLTLDLFKPAGPVPKFKIAVDKLNLALLQKDTRKYVRAEVKVGDVTLTDVGLHLKGAAGSYRDWNDKPALTLNADKLTKHQTFRGLDKFHLNNSVQDGAYLSEILCAEMALAAGLPASRGTHALVELNGRKVGLYVLKEGFDAAFLRRHFDDPSGNLYDGGFLTDIDGPLQLDHGRGNDRKDLRALLKACQEPDGKKRFAAVEKLLDVDRFVTNVVLQVVACDWDGYVRNRNNYRVYFDPKSGKAVFFPHGMDQEFQNTGDSLFPGWGGIVARAVLETPEGKAKYVARVKEFVEKYFVYDKLAKRVDALAARVVAALAATDKGAADGYANEVKQYKDRLKQRADYLKQELPKLK